MSVSKLLPTLLLLIPFCLPSFAQTLYDGSPESIFEPTNWDNGLPSFENPGTIDTDAFWPTDNDINGWDLTVIDGGFLQDESISFALNEIYGGSFLTIDGGEWYRGGTQRFHGGAIVTIKGEGIAELGGIAGTSAMTGGGEDGGFVLNVESGSFESLNLINFNNQENESYINVSGGLAEMGYGSSDLRPIDEPNTFFNVSGGTLDLHSLIMDANDSSIVVTVSGGEFIVGEGGYNPNSIDGITDQRHVNFPNGSTGSWTLVGADESSFMGFYEEGVLLFEGGNSLPFAKAFEVSGDTIVSLLVEDLCDPDNSADFDGNGTVEFADFLILSANFGMTVGDHTRGDADCNGTVEFADFLILSANFGTSTSGAQAVPEPISLPVFGLAGLLLIARGRKSRES